MQQRHCAQHDQPQQQHTHEQQRVAAHRTGDERTRDVNERELWIDEQRIEEGGKSTSGATPYRSRIRQRTARSVRAYASTP
ncbi:MAG: hypothetical protein HND48_06920 [Chloroflexi bacterium]|nr:hypothetical protein [Chloroflexota bacterium]